MLSKVELEFLKAPDNLDAKYARVLKHRIKGKVGALQDEIQLLSAAGFITQKRNAITKIRNTNQAPVGSPGEIRTLGFAKPVFW
jgi:hypothetical protein